MTDSPDLHHYLPVDEDAIQWGMYVTGVGRVSIRPGRPYPPPGHPGPYDFRWHSGRTLPEFQTLLITDGGGLFESHQTGLVTVESGSLMFLFPDVWHRYQPNLETGWTERWLSFNGELAHRLMERGPITPESAVRQAHDREQVATAFDRLHRDIHTARPRNTILLSLHAMSLLATIIEAVAWQELGQAPLAAEDERSADPLVARAVDFIWTRSHQPITVAKIALALDVNRRTLERRFAAERGHSILAEINDCRLNRAKRLLEETNLPVKAITYLAGFTSEQRMRATFLGRDGVPPSEYRKAARQAMPVA